MTRDRDDGRNPHGRQRPERSARYGRTVTRRKNDQTGETRFDRTSETHHRSHLVAQLHRQYGNRTVGELVDRGTLQAQLSVSNPGDRDERAADRVARRVVRGDAAAVTSEGDEEVQSSPARPQVTNENGTLDEFGRSQRDGGRSMAPPVRSFFEERFGRDFSDVRIHTGAGAAAMASALGADAFTTGRDVFFGAGRYEPDTRAGRRLLAHELTHVTQQVDGGERSVQRQVSAGGGHVEQATLGTITPNFARGLSDEALQELIGRVQAATSVTVPGSADRDALEWNLEILEFEDAFREQTNELPAYDVGRLSGWLIREGYIREVTDLLPTSWRGMSESQLTDYLSENFTEAELEERFLRKYDRRQAIKDRVRKRNIVAALVVGVVWAQENIQEGEWGRATAKVTLAGLAGWAVNRLLYARDKSARSLMAAKGAAFGRWFQGAARTNRYVNLLARAGGWLALLEFRQAFMSGGYGGPNIPFDLIVEIDIDDPSTWTEPNQTLLDMGFNVWYQQACTPDLPEACGEPLYVGVVYGSLLRGIGKLLDISTHERKGLRENLYRVEGAFDEVDLLVVTWVRRRVEASENVLVVATGRVSGGKIGARGHHREVEVRPANDAAAELFDGWEPQFVPSHLLHPADVEALHRGR